MMLCYFCQGPTVLYKEPLIEYHPKNSHHFESRTCQKCQTTECSLEFNFMVSHNEDPPELINYCLKANGYTAWIGVKYPGTEITEDKHTATHGTVITQTICHPILFLNISAHLNPSNFLDKFKTYILFS